MKTSLLARVFVVAMALVAVLFSRTASAHTVGVSSSRWALEGAVLRGELVFSAGELARAIPRLDADADGVLSLNELNAGEMLDREVVARVTVVADGESCAVARRGVGLTEQDGVVVTLEARCAARPQKLVLHAGFLELLPAGHRDLVTIDVGDGKGAREAVTVLANMDVTLDVGAPTEGNASFRSLVVLGIEHILTGYDHLVFVFGLVVAGGRTRSLVAALTAFTLAHSLSLALAVLGVWAPRASIVEPAIALSIAWVGLENLWQARQSGDRRDPARRRWMLTFPFGLIHGFGFAGALSEIGLPRERIPGALLGFNLGVELGQLVVLAAILPLLVLVRRWAIVRGLGMRLANAAIVGAGGLWFILRVSGA